MVAFRKAGLKKKVQNLSSLATDSPGKLDVLGHDGDPLGVDGAQVGVLKESNQVGLTGFLESGNSRALEPQVGLEVLCNFTDQTLEWELADEELSGLLVTTDLTQSNGTRLVTMGLLDTSGGWGALAGSFGSQLFPWGLASSGFASSLLGTSHCIQRELLEELLEERRNDYLVLAFWFYTLSNCPPKIAKGIWLVENRCIPLVTFDF